MREITRNTFESAQASLSDKNRKANCVPEFISRERVEMSRTIATRIWIQWNICRNLGLS